MRILSFTAENFKRLRVVEIVPKGRMTTISGRNGQGKTSVLDALWALFAGKKAIPEKPVRRGAEKSKLSAVLGDEEGRPVLIAKRVIAGDRTTSLSIEAAPGAERPAGTPQAVLDELIGAMSFDPVAFIHLEAKKQVEVLRSLVKLDVDLEKLSAASASDYAERTVLNRKAVELRAQAAAVVYSPGLPAAKVDEEEIRTRIVSAQKNNQELAAKIEEKSELHADYAQRKSALERHQNALREQAEKVEELRRRLSAAENTLLAFEKVTVSMEEQVQAAATALQNAPDVNLADTSALVSELQAAHLTNQEIDKRSRRLALDEELTQVEREAARLTRTMEGREERKREALAGAQMPVDGLTFSEDGVFFKGIPLEQLGEAEQIRVGCALAMAANPKLRCVPIAHGESLDDDSLALIEQMAEENDFQIFMARVETSGTVGIVLEDGLVKTVNG